MTDQLVKQSIESLLEERRGYETRMIEADGDAKAALKDRIVAVNASLTRLGYKLEPAAKAAEKKTTVKTTSKKAAPRKSTAAPRKSTVRKAAKK